MVFFSSCSFHSLHLNIKPYPHLPFPCRVVLNLLCSAGLILFPSYVQNMVYYKISHVDHRISNPAAQAPARASSAVRLFDAHCHLQDPRVAAVAPALMRAAAASGVARFAVNGTSEEDWHLVKRMAEDHPAVVPCFGLHPW